MWPSNNPSDVKIPSTLENSSSTTWVLVLKIRKNNIANLLRIRKILWIYQKVFFRLWFQKLCRHWKYSDYLRPDEGGTTWNKNKLFQLSTFIDVEREGRLNLPILCFKIKVNCICTEASLHSVGLQLTFDDRRIEINWLEVWDVAVERSRCNKEELFNLLTTIKLSLIILNRT